MAQTLVGKLKNASPSERINAVMKLNGLTHDDVAGRLGVSRQTFSRMMNGHSHMKLSKLERVAKALGVSTSMLVR